MSNNYETIDLACPNCHGTMEYDEDKKEILCPYCRHKIIVKDSENIEDLIEKEKRLSYAKVEGEKLAEEEEKNRFRKRARKRFMLFILTLVIICFTMYYFILFTKKYIEDPFQYVSISFSGISGNGTAYLNIDNNIKKDIEYSLSKDSKLDEGEVIYLSAKSNIYRFKNYKKEIIVTGLNSYISNIDDLTSEVIDYLHNISCEFQKDKIENAVTFKGELVSLEPYKVYLTTNFESQNTIDDVYIAKIKTTNGNIYEKYVDTCYRNVILINNENELLRYESKRNIGGSIKAGNPASFSGPEYIGFMTGFITQQDVEEHIKNNSDTSMKVFEK